MFLRKFRRYLEKYADPNDEPTSPLYDQSFEDMDLPVDRWKGQYQMKHTKYRSYLLIFISFFFLFKIYLIQCNRIGI